MIDFLCRIILCILENVVLICLSVGHISVYDATEDCTFSRLQLHSVDLAIFVADNCCDPHFLDNGGKMILMN